MSSKVICLMLTLIYSSLGWEEALSQGQLSGFLNIQGLEDLMTKAANDHSTASTAALYTGVNYIKLHNSGLTASSRVVVSAAMFAGYPFGPQMVAYLIEKLTEEEASTPAIKALLLKSEVILIPYINKAGLEKMETDFATNSEFKEIFKNLNAGCTTDEYNQGVNINRNWDYQFCTVTGEDDECNKGYCGASAFSETESSAARDIMTASSIPLTLWIHLDRSGNIALVPYSANKSTNKGVLYDYIYNTSFNGVIGSSWSVGNVADLGTDGTAESGTLIDYGLSRDIVTLEVGISDTRTKDSGDILGVLQENYDIIFGLLEIGSYSYNSTSSTMTDTACGTGYTCTETNVTTYTLYTFTLQNTGTATFTLAMQAAYDTNTYKIGEASFVSTSNVDNASSSSTAISTSTSPWTLSFLEHSTIVISVVAEPLATTARMLEERKLNAELVIDFYPDGLSTSANADLVNTVDPSGGSSGSGTTTNTGDEASPRDSLHDATIAGIVISILIILGVVTVVIVFLLKGRKGEDDQDSDDNEVPPIDAFQPADGDQRV